MKYNKFPLESITIKLPDNETNNIDFDFTYKNYPIGFNEKYGYDKTKYDYKIMTKTEDWYKCALLTNLYEFLTLEYSRKATFLRKYEDMKKVFDFSFIKDKDGQFLFEDIKMIPVPIVNKTKTYYIFSEILSDTNIIEIKPIKSAMYIDFYKGDDNIFEISDIINKYYKGVSNITAIFYTDKEIKKNYGNSTGSNSNLKPDDIKELSKSKNDLFIVNSTIKIDRTYQIREFAYHQLMFNHITTAFNVLNIGGTFILYVYELLSDHTVNMLALLKLYFDDVTLHKSYLDIAAAADAYIICTNFKGVDNKLLDKMFNITSKWYKLDSSRGTKLNIKEPVHRAPYIDLRPYDDKNDVCIFPDNLITYKLDDKFIGYIKQFNYLVTLNQIGKISQTLNYGKYIYSLSENEKVALYTKIFDKQKNAAIAYCVDNNIKMNEIYLKSISAYKEFTIDRLKYFFPPTKNFNKLQMSTISDYSVTPFYDADMISKIISKIMKTNDLIITDATANVGGNTLSFLKHFKKVNSIELTKTHYEMLKNNINVYGLQNKSVLYNSDYLEIKNKLSQDVIFMDLPWNGPVYKELDKMDLYLGGTNMINIVNDLKNSAKLIIAKVPKNYNYDTFFRESFTKEFYVHHFKKYNVLFVKQHLFV
jgi:23S rRNA U2552 (ribose-2'-O)-methylase RlmE/FtsJ